MPYFPAADLSGFLRGIRNAKDRAGDWVVSFELQNGETASGRVKSSPYRIDDEIILEVTPTTVRSIPISQIYFASTSLTSAPYSCEHLAVTQRTLTSELARKQGMRYAIHAIRGERKLLEKMRDPALVAKPSRGTGWRTANYLELVGPSHDRVTRTTDYALVFGLSVLDRSDYFITPDHNWGTRMKRTIEATDKVGLARLFWEIAGDHMGKKNEMVIKDAVSYSHLRKILVSTHRKDSLLTAIAAEGLEAPEGHTWDNLLEFRNDFSKVIYP